jgi:protein-tyrosine phosphatase
MAPNITGIKVGNHILYSSDRPGYRLDLKIKDPIEDYIKVFLSKDIKCIILLLDERDLKNYYGKADLIQEYEKAGIKVIHYPIPDFSVPSDIVEFNDIMKKMDANLKVGNILVHCAGGSGRTGTVVSAFLLYKGMSDDLVEIINFIRQDRPHSVETEEQFVFLQKYQKFLNNLKG